jgi:hypothetical protein
MAELAAHEVGPKTKRPTYVIGWDDAMIDPF